MHPKGPHNCQPDEEIGRFTVRKNGVIMCRPVYSYCPLCAHTLIAVRDSDGTMRQSCPSCGWMFYPHMAVSVAAVLVESGRVLLVRRRHPPFAGTWMFPSGFVEYGEHPHAATVREMKEETNLSVEVRNLLQMSISSDDFREPRHLALFFSVSCPTGFLRNEDAENLEVRWFCLHETIDIRLELHKRLAKQMMREHRQ